MANSNLTNAKRAKNDEFYTQYHDIEKEIAAYVEYNPYVFRGKTILMPCDDPEWSNFTKFFAQNFEKFGLKKLISTSYAVDSKIYKSGYQLTLFEETAPQYDKNKTTSHGKIFTLNHDKTSDGKIDVEDLEWNYLDGDGDFNSDEVRKLRDEADIIITNPPFSLFRDFLAWIVEADKQFVIIGNINAITYKEVFPLIKEDKIWLGATNFNTGMYFIRIYDGESYIYQYWGFIVTEHRINDNFTDHEGNPIDYDYSIYFTNQSFINYGGLDHANIYANYVKSSLEESWTKQVNDWNLAKDCLNNMPLDYDSNYEVFINDNERWYHIAESNHHIPGPDRKSGR